MSKKYFCICKKGFRKFHYFKNHQNSCNYYKQQQNNLYKDISKSKLNSKCVFCSPVRNVAKHLDKNLENIETMSKVFSDYYICFFYDQSKDNTLLKLQNFQKKHPNKMKIIINNEPLLKYRTHRIANARNKIVEYIEENLNDFEYMIMFDADEICCYDVNLNVLRYHLNLNSWDALSFNRSGLPKGHENYDIWALLYEPFIHHCHSYNGCLDIVFAMRDDITKKLNNLKLGELFECYSAFNGIAIYRLKKFKNCKYDGEKQKYFSDERINEMLEYLRKTYNKNLTINFDFVDPSHGGGKQIADHVNFHISAIRKNNAKIRISGESLFF